MQKLKEGVWYDTHYNSYRIYLNKTFTINIQWESSGDSYGYKINVNGMTLKERPRELEVAKELSLTFAHKIVSNLVSTIESIK